MELKKLLQRLKEVQNVYDNYPPDAPNGSLALSELIAEVELACAPTVPAWSNSQGVIDPDLIDDNTFDNGPIEISLTRIHQTYTNACQWKFTGAEPVQNDHIVDQFMDFMCENHSYEDDGEHVPDEYLVKVLLGRDPERKVLNAFLNGMLSIAGMEEKDVQRIFRNWAFFYNKAPEHMGFMVETEGSDT